MMTEGNGGELRPTGRFERIERILERIEIKLDAKAEQVEIDRIAARVEATDRKVGEQIAAAVPLLEQFRTVIGDVERLKVGGSDARRALDLAHNNDKRLVILETRAKVEDAVAEVQGEIRSSRKWLIGLVVGSAATLVAGVLSVLHSLNPTWP